MSHDRFDAPLRPGEYVLAKPGPCVCHKNLNGSPGASCFQLGWKANTIGGVTGIKVACSGSRGDAEVRDGESRLDAANRKADEDRAKVAGAGAPEGAMTRMNVGAVVKSGGGFARGRWQILADDAPRVAGEERKVMSIDGITRAVRVVAVPG
jgi:hypothetical protein